MPGDTFAAVRAISKAQPKVKVLMLTVSESEDDAYSALEGGAQGSAILLTAGTGITAATATEVPA